MGGGVTYALEASTNEVDNNKEWKPEGNVIAQGEDGVPWELYENGYLLFKPEPGKDTLSNPNGEGLQSWKQDYRKQIKAIGFSDTVYAPEDSSYLFYSPDRMPLHMYRDSYTNLDFIDTKKIDTSKVKNMSYMFKNLVKIKNLDVSNFDLSNVVNIKGMFQNMASLESLNVSNWNTSNVEDMSGVFNNTHKLKNLDVSNWNTSKVINMMGTFLNASSITELDVGKWNVSNVQRMEYMFSDMHSLSHLDVSNWNTSNVKNVAYMFSTLTSLKELNVGNWNTTNVSNMVGVFSDSTKLKTLNIKNWDTTNVVLMDNMFKGLESLIKITIGEKLANSSLTGNLFEGLDNIEGIKDEHYNQTWERALNENGDLSDEKTTVYNIDENDTSNSSKYWNDEYRKSPKELAGTYVRDKDSLSIKYYSKETDETIKYKRFIDDKKDDNSLNNAILEHSNNVMPKIDYPGYKFVGWLVRTQSPEWNGTNEQIVLEPIEKVFHNSIHNEYWANAIPDGKLDKEKSVFNITFYAKWEKVENITKQRNPIEPTIVYKADNNLDKGNRTEEEGQVGEKEIVTTYKTTPITGELTDPTTTENVITPMRPKVVKVGTKPTEVEKQINLPITETQSNTLVRGKEKVIQGRPRIEKEITEYTVNETTGDITENKRIEVVDEGTPTIKEIGIREPNTIIRDINGKDLTDDELPNYTNPERTPTSITDNGDLVYIVHKIITKYKGNDTLDINKQVVEKDGKTDGVKLIQVGTKPTVTTIERDNKQIKQTTTYIVNEDTGELTSNTTEEIIGDVKPTTSNGTEAPLTFELPEYTNPISTNTPIDENGDLVLPPIVDKLEYTGTLSTNTPVDKDDNLILPPIVDIPEYKDDIVNEPQKVTKEKLQSKESNQQTPTEIYHQSDKKQDVVKDNIVVDNNNVAQKQVLPKTNAFYSTPYVIGLLLSAIGLKQNKKD